MGCPCQKKPRRQGGSCGLTPPVVEINNPEECPVTFHTVVISADRGDDRTGEVLPVNGLYKNVILKYEANKAMYIYNSDGIPCKIETSLSTSLYFDDLIGRPKYNNIEMTSATNIPLVPTSAVAYSGSYSDLLGLPTIDTVLSTTSNNAVQNSTIANAFNDINALIPAQASTDNQLADKAFVNSSIQTATANFRGSWADWGSVPTVATDYPEDFDGNRTPTYNDYMVVGDASAYPDQVLTGAWRFKYNGSWDNVGKNGWIPEYQINDTVFTAEQLAAINSGITANLVAKIADFTGATSLAAGANGLVPAPAAGDQNKVLRGDGTWGSGAGAIESFTIATSSWNARPQTPPYSYAPYTRYATVTATNTIGNSSLVALLNDQADLFAQYGFVIGEVSGQVITIYSIGTPTASVTLKVEIA